MKPWHTIDWSALRDSTGPATGIPALLDKIADNGNHAYTAAGELFKRFEMSMTYSGALPAAMALLDIVEHVRPRVAARVALFLAQILRYYPDKPYVERDQGQAVGARLVAQRWGDPEYRAHAMVLATLTKAGLPVAREAAASETEALPLTVALLALGRFDDRESQALVARHLQSPDEDTASAAVLAALELGMPLDARGRALADALDDDISELALNSELDEGELVERLQRVWPDRRA